MQRRNLLILLSFACLNLLSGQLSSAADTDLSSLGYVLQAEHLASSREKTVNVLSAADRDILIIDATFDGSSRWTREEISRIRMGKEGRRVLCYLSIGEAEDYRSYWNSVWDADRDGTPDSGAPKFLHAENPDWEGNYKVRYWHPQWQAVIAKEIDQILTQGFDGVYLDIVDAFEFFEFDAATDEWIDDRQNPETGNTYRRDMINFVTKIRRQIDQPDRTRFVVPQNGEALLASSDYVMTIDAIGVEDLFTNGKRAMKERQIKYRTSFLQKAIDAGKQVYVIEYPRNQKARDSSMASAKGTRYSLLLTDRDLKTVGDAVID